MLMYILAVYLHTYNQFMPIYYPIYKILMVEFNNFLKKIFGTDNCHLLVTASSQRPDKMS